jgi:hypothetical protein
MEGGNEKNTCRRLLARFWQRWVSDENAVDSAEITARSWVKTFRIIKSQEQEVPSPRAIDVNFRIELRRQSDAKDKSLSSRARSILPYK